MQRLSLFFAILLLSIGASQAATLSGTVYYQSGPTVMANHTITIADTNNTWNTTVVTDAYGHYSVTIPASVPTTAPGYQINVSTGGCGVYVRDVAVNVGSPVVNFYLCSGGAAVSGLQGTVSLGSTTNSGQAMVYLILKAYDPVLMDTVLTAIDSFLTAPTGGTFSKSYSSMPSGVLLLKAALLSSHPSYSGFLPTYASAFPGVISWTGAGSLGLASFTGNATNITMAAGTNPGGPGFIGGSVLLGANKSTAVGDPLNSRILILTKTTGEKIAYTHSDAAGKFEFPSLPYGSYRIFGDAMGKANPPLIITVSAAQPTVNNIIFEENNKKFEGHLGTLGVGGVSGLAGVSVYPNPATDFVQVKGLSAISGSKTVLLSSVTGMVISRQTLEHGDASIPIATLPAGVYMLQVQSEAGTASFRISK